MDEDNTPSIEKERTDISASPENNNLESNPDNVNCIQGLISFKDVKQTDKEKNAKFAWRRSFLESDERIYWWKTCDWNDSNVSDLCRKIVLGQKRKHS